ncbi:MAG: phosphate ABC transporter permease PstA [Eubacterium sp.]|nr:phosphate ABC transporter permease PstA [Eubacterium sp.]
MKTNIEKTRKIKERAWKIVMLICAALTCAILIFIIGYVFVQGVGGLSIEFLTTKPSYLSGNIGILPDILNTVYILIVSILVLLPLGVGAAIYLSEYATNHRIVKLVDYAAEILSGIPSIIYGLVGMLFFCQFLNMKTSLLAGALTLVVMNLPTIMRTTRESLLTVQKGLREGAYALGASKWRVVRTIVIPECLDGIITGCILSAGRILGESAALLFTAGFAHTLHGFFDGITSSGATLTVALYVYAKEQGEFQIAFSIAVILLILAVIVNLCAVGVKRHFQKKKSI